MVKDGVRKCKVCGREYPHCETNRPVNINRWQDVACCPDHAAIYFAEIDKSRSAAKPDADTEQTESESLIADYTVDDEDEDDAFFDEDFEDDEEDEEESEADL